LLSALSEAALDASSVFSVFGGDYPTRDGTAVRDLIHITDLARAHSRAIESLDAQTGMNVFNLGTGQGYTVLEVLREFEKASGRKIAHRIISARPGDVPVSFTDPARSKAVLHWVAEHDLHDICRDAWRWTLKTAS
jgi:UDP-glucose 4-epimerase